jgi:2-oxo-4-hydroxy-4-carboxy-5-ureidoimidazoline decarboxylase
MFNKINKLSESEFAEVFGNIFENARWIAEVLYKEKPFENFQKLKEKMIFIFEKTDNKNKLKILKSHPDLADKTKIGSLTADSNKEQGDARLDRCTKGEFSEFKKLNSQYKDKFGFPFILAVKDKNKIEILTNFKKRIFSTKDIEFNEAIKQVKKIASLRLEEIQNKFI